MYTERKKFLKKMNTYHLDILESVGKIRSSAKTLTTHQQNLNYNSLYSKRELDINDSNTSNIPNKTLKKNILSKKIDYLLNKDKDDDIYKIQTNSIPGKIKGNIKRNKDNYFKIEKILNNENNLIVGVIDGNGVYGKQISEFIKINFMKLILEKINKNIKPLDFDKGILIKIIKKTYLELNNMLINETNFNLLSSGCTLSFVLIINKLIFSSNIGDSKCIMIQNLKSKLSITELSRIHDISNNKEMERIILKGGEIRTDKIKKSKRIFQKDKEYPGIKITRSFGNLWGRKIGLIENPFIAICKITKNIVSVVLGTSGLWNNITENKIIDSFDLNNKNVYCSKLIKLSRKELLKNKDYNEDMTCTTIVFNKHYK